MFYPFLVREKKKAKYCQQYLTEFVLCEFTLTRLPAPELFAVFLSTN